MSLRFLHFADLHLGIENYGYLDPSTGLHSRVKDFTQSLSFVCSLAIQEEVDLVIFAGDAYKTCDPSPTFQREFALQIRRLQQAEIPLVMVVGNHDAPVAFGKATSIDIFSALELDKTHVVRRPSLLQIDTRSGPVQIAGLPWPTRHLLRTHEEYKDLPQEAITKKIQEICTTQIEEFARQLNPSMPAILTAHIAAAEATYSGSERTAIIGQDPTLLTSVLAHPAFDYVALGHVHKHQDLHHGTSPPVVYAGSIERINFGEEHDEKGFCMVEIEEQPAEDPANRIFHTAFEFIPTPARSFVTVELEVLEGEDPTEQIIDAIGETPIEDAVVRVLYTLPATNNYTVDLNRIHEALAPAYCVAGIQPQIAPSTRQRRAAITEDLGLPEALDKYIANNPQLQDQRDNLQRVARELERELELLTPQEDAT
jgi:exonuclease SbcD